MAVALTDLLSALGQNGGSDLHLAANSCPMLRIRDAVLPIKMPPLSSAEIDEMLMGIMDEGQKKTLKEQLSVDFAIGFKGIGLFRVNVFNQRHGRSAVFRNLPEKMPTIEQLHLPEVFKTIPSYPNGLVLVTGPTGSGKSTTLAAVINLINETQRGHILTLEDPIEFRHESKLCMVNQRALGDHFRTFSEALKAALREDPDVILVGEMRDLETIKLALEAAETGHLVFATLHTNSAPKSIDRIINVFPGEDQNQIRIVLSETLRFVASQKLVPTADGKRRIGLHDIFINNSATANLIRENKTFQILTAMQTGKNVGMQVLDKELLDAVNRGEVKGEVAWESANNKDMFKQWASKEVSALAAGVNPESKPNSQPGSAGSAGLEAKKKAA